MLLTNVRTSIINEAKSISEPVRLSEGLWYENGEQDLK